jgi:hypothetical protein
MTRVLALMSLCVVLLAQAWGVEPPAQGIMVNKTTLVPIRSIAEWLGAKVDYDDSIQRITLHMNTKTILLILNSSKAIINDKEHRLTAPAMERNGVTYIPLRFIAEGFEALVEWDSTRQLATIINPMNKQTLQISISNGEKATPMKAARPKPVEPTAERIPELVAAGTKRMSVITGDIIALEGKINDPTTDAKTLVPIAEETIIKQIRNDKGSGRLIIPGLTATSKPSCAFTVMDDGAGGSLCNTEFPTDRFVMGAGNFGDGSLHRFAGTVTIKDGISITGDADLRYHVTFAALDDIGYVYVRGKGTVNDHGVSIQLPNNTPNTGVLDLVSTPPGAQIMVDSRPTGLVTPCRIVIDQGTQLKRIVSITATLPGYRKATYTAAVITHAETAYSITLQKESETTP